MPVAGECKVVNVRFYVQKCVHFCQDACEYMINCEKGKEVLI
jgi:hypothetical protein